MKRVVLGRTGIEVSYLGIGTSAAYDGIVCGAKLKPSDYPRLLCFAYEHGITFWDTSLTYGTHGAIREALKSIPRGKVVICSKTIESSGIRVRHDVGSALRGIDTDYIDIFLIQCLRNKFDLWYRSEALDMLCKMKEKGYIRAVGVASHGIGALESCKKVDRIDVVMGRVNYSGHLMDSRQDNIKSVLAGIPTIKKISQRLIPRSIFKDLASSVQKPVASNEDRQIALKIFQELHSLGKGIIGMKILGEGHLAGDVPHAIGFVKSLPFVTSIVLGCCSEKEIMEAVRAVGVN